MSWKLQVLMPLKIEGRPPIESVDFEGQTMAEVVYEVQLFIIEHGGWFWVKINHDNPYTDVETYMEVMSQDIGAEEYLDISNHFQCIAGEGVIKVWSDVQLKYLGWTNFHIG